MNGSSHLIIGCGAAVALAYVGVKHDDVRIICSSISIPVGAVLPDVDHDRTKLGRNRILIVNRLKQATAAILAIFIAYTAITSYIAGGPVSAVFGVLNSLVPFTPLLLCVVVANSNKFKKNTKFYRKHRGIMHTLAPVVGLVLGSIVLDDSVFMQYLILGISVGYTTHLISDMQTTMGCPLLWPFTDKCIPGLPIRTGTPMEKVMVAVDLGGLACLAYYL